MSDPQTTYAHDIRASVPRRFVCGFCFDSPVGNVALIVKNRPEAQAGSLNGLGGLILPGETPRSAMARKFQQEGGIFVSPEDWSCFHTERYVISKDVVYFMVAKSSLFHLIQTKTDEHVVLTDASRVGAPSGTSWGQPVFDERYIPPMYNLSYLIPMAMSWLMRPKDRYFES
jgi:8-oxo-dGTP pyrophosphatase MutT (NUDIX family)